MFIKFLAFIIVGITFQTAVCANEYRSDEESAYFHNKTSLRIGVSSVERMPYWGGDLAVPNGAIHGIVKLIQETMDIDVKYIEYTSATEMTKALKNREIDIILDLDKNFKKSDDFIFTPPLIKSIRAAWISDVSIEDHALFYKLSWACIKGSSHCDVLYDLDYPKVIEVNTSNELYEKLELGEVDAILDVFDSLNFYLSDHLSVKGRLHFDKNFGFYNATIMMSKDDELLRTMLNKIILNLKESVNNPIKNIMQSYGFNSEEYRRWLIENQEIRKVRYTVAEDIYPFSYWNKIDGKYTGYIHDVMMKVNNRSPFHLEYIPTEGRSVTQMLDDGIVDIVNLRNDDVNDDGRYRISKPFTSINYVLVETLSDYTDIKIGVLSLNNLISANEIPEGAQLFSDIKLLLDNLESGVISHAYINEDLVDSLLFSGAFNVFKLVPTHDLPLLKIEFAMIFRQESADLNTLMDTVINEFSERELDSLWWPYRRIDYKWGLDQETVINYLMIFLIALLVLSGTIYFFILQMNKKIKLSNERVSTTEIKNRWLSHLIDTIPSMIVISDNNGKLLLTNKKYKDMQIRCGFTQEKELVDAMLSDVMLQLVDEFEVTIKIKSDVEILNGLHYNIRNSMIETASKNGNQYLTVFYDVSELKNAELTLITLNDKAHESIMAQQHFLAVVSHELRTPISAMKGLMEILRADIDSVENQEVLTNAINSADRLKLLVNDILDFSKLNANQMTINNEMCNLVQELCPVLRGFEATAESNGLNFIVDWQPSSYLEAEVDILKVIQVISNILSNSIKFTDSGFISVAVEVTKNELVLTIRDTGLGMTEQQLERLFEAFIQAEGSIARRYGGTGLGMSIVQNLILLMQGKIVVTSQPMLGTVVKVNIPIEASEYVNINQSMVMNINDKRLVPWMEALSTRYILLNDEIDVKTNLYPDFIFKAAEETYGEVLQTSKTSIEYDPLKGNILVVDDDSINCFLIEKQLKQLGLSFVVVSNGFEALEVLKNSELNFDLVLTDCHMPMLNGYELTEKIRSLGNSCETIPIIACTADNSDHVIEDGLSVGMNDFLFKPYTLSEMYLILSKYIGITDDSMLFSSSLLDSYENEQKGEMLNVVIESFTQSHNELTQTTSENGIKMIAHRVKGAAGALKMTDLYNVAEKLENSANNEIIKGNLLDMMEARIIEANELLAKIKAKNQ